MVGWPRAAEIPAVPINHSPVVIDSENVVWKDKGSWKESIMESIMTRAKLHNCLSSNTNKAHFPQTWSLPGYPGLLMALIGRSCQETSICGEVF